MFGPKLAYSIATFVLLSVEKRTGFCMVFIKNNCPYADHFRLFVLIVVLFNLSCSGYFLWIFISFDHTCWTNRVDQQVWGLSDTTAGATTTALRELDNLFVPSYQVDFPRKGHRFLQSKLTHSCQADKKFLIAGPQSCGRQWELPPTVSLSCHAFWKTHCLSGTMFTLLSFLRIAMHCFVRASLSAG